MADLRETLEANWDKSEAGTLGDTGTGGEPPATPPAPSPAEPSGVIPTPPEPKEPGVAPPKPEPGTPTAPPPQPVPGDPTDQMPKSWKPEKAALWAQVPKEIRQEVHRREGELLRSFGENSQVREFAKQFSEISRPFEARMQALGVTPLQAFNELLRADYILSTAPPVQRAQYLAKIIKDYGVDIRELDNALAGEPAADPVQSQIDKLLQERLQPLMGFVNEQRQAAQASQQQTVQQAQTVIDQMAADTAKYPFFDRVRVDMADIIDMFARRQIYLTPEQAYQRAVAMDPQLAAQTAQQMQAAQQLANAQKAHAGAQRALAASASVAGAPTGTPTARPNGDGSSLRDTIEAAFDNIGR